MSKLQIRDAGKRHGHLGALRGVSLEVAGGLVALLGLGLLLAACGDGETEAAYVCPPCSVHETLHFEHDGECPVCGMKLTETPDTARVGHVDIHEGSGNFVIPGGPGHEGDLVIVYYHRPVSFTPDSPILVVVPGAGRDAWEYRDAWVDASRAHGILVLAPHYPEGNYPFQAYHMGGLMQDVNVEEAARFVEGSHEAVLDETALTFEVNHRPETWIFDDFDRLFERAAEAVGSGRTGYDLFGHSAGGQILHRLVLVRPGVDARRIVTANAGFYTLPDLEADLPFGLAGTGVEERDLAASFARDLTLLLGGDDDHPEAGGTFLRSPSADEQGMGRLQRGRHFHRAGREMAEELGVPFDWEVRVVPGVGHDHRGMSEAAADFLYGGSGG